MTGPRPIGDTQPALVFFTADSTLLDDAAKATIRQSAADALAQSASVHVRGFAAPDTGTAAFNRDLARTRAQQVADGLVAAGVPSNRISIEARGAVPFEMMPTESRRVDILLGR